MALPERINAIKTVTYIPAEVKESLILMNPDMEITDEEVIDLIAEWAYEDIGGGFILQDENGNEL